MMFWMTNKGNENQINNLVKVWVETRAYDGEVFYSKIFTSTQDKLSGGGGVYLKANCRIIIILNRLKSKLELASLSTGSKHIAV